MMDEYTTMTRVSSAVSNYNSRSLDMLETKVIQQMNVAVSESANSFEFEKVRRLLTHLAFKITDGNIPTAQLSKLQAMFPGSKTENNGRDHLFLVPKALSVEFVDVDTAETSVDNDQTHTTAKKGEIIVITLLLIATVIFPLYFLFVKE